MCFRCRYTVDFDFLGKDSIRYQNSVDIDKRVFKNLKLFMENKKPGDDLFDRVDVRLSYLFGIFCEPSVIIAISCRRRRSTGICRSRCLA